MKKLFITGIIAAFAMQFAQASTVCDAKTSLNDARSNLVEMVGMSDKAAEEGIKAELDALREKVNAATTNLKTAIAALEGENAETASKDVVATLKTTWADFENTRESEIMPNVYSGKKADAKAIATGIQAERMAVMNDSISKLGGDSCEEAK
ncbi:MCP four helix bundle domain-containing protein [Candidatus Halobeggiatoa sp. HSG11]|nr:MCP four helix bundle domain-containing protein [Candidatus Halobeggiatoa sp. HSG11]